MLAGGDDAPRIGRLVFPGRTGIPMKRLTSTMLLARFPPGALIARSTAAGTGKDVQKVGEKGEQEAVGRMDDHS